MRWTPQRRWPILLNRATRGYAEALEAGNLAEAFAWGRIGLGILVVELSNPFGAQAAAFDLIEENFKAEHGLRPDAPNPALHPPDELDGPADGVSPCSECGAALMRSRVADFPGALTCSPGCGRRRRANRLDRHHAAARP